MNGQQIRARIDENNAKIRAALNKFVLTDEINQLMQDNEEMRAICQHNFVNGWCQYCDIPEELKDD